MPQDLTRLDRLLTERGLGSRRQVRTLIRAGRVHHDGNPVRDAAAKLPAGCTLIVDGAPVSAPPWLGIVHKPVGVHSTVGDPQGRPNLAELTAPLLRLGLHPVGRLDHDSEGLLPFARDGALTQRLLHPRHGVEKVYLATVQGTPPADLQARLAAGVPTSDGPAFARLIDVRGDQVRLAVSEGRHRIVRRMLNNTGLPVLALRREAFGALTLGDLPEGAWRPATDQELTWARSLLNGST